MVLTTRPGRLKTQYKTPHKTVYRLQVWPLLKNSTNDELRQITTQTDIQK